MKEKSGKQEKNAKAKRLGGFARMSKQESRGMG